MIKLKGSYSLFKSHKLFKLQFKPLKRFQVFFIPLYNFVNNKYTSNVVLKGTWSSINHSNILELIYHKNTIVLIQVDNIISNYFMWYDDTIQHLKQLIISK